MIQKSYRLMALCGALLSSAAFLSANIIPFEDAFESYPTGNLDAVASAWDAIGNSKVVRGTPSRLAGAGAGKWIDAGTGVAWAVRNAATGGQLAEGESFTVSTLIGFNQGSFWGGLWIGSDAQRYQAVVMGNNDMGFNANVSNNLVRTYTTSDGRLGEAQQVDNLQSSPPNLTARGVWYRLIVSGQQGSEEVHVSVVNTMTDGFLVKNQPMRLGRAVAVGDRFGFGSINSGALQFDHFTLSNDASGVATARQPAKHRPNIVLFMTDDNLGELGILGTKGLLTPNLDRLAQEGVLFTKANNPTATCSPARTTVHSGMYANEHLVWHNVFPLTPHHEPGRPLNWVRNDMAGNLAGEVHSFNRLEQWWPVPNKDGRRPTVLDDKPTLNTILRDQGYYLGLTQKHHLGYPHRFPFDYFRMWRPGLDRADNPPGHKTYYHGMREFMDNAGDQPFFIVVNLTWTHRPFPNFEGITRLPMPDPDAIELPPFLPDTPLVRKDKAIYYTTIQACDEHAGEVIAAIQDAGRYLDTIFIFQPDDGSTFLRHKNTCYETGITLPLIMKGPGIERLGIREDLVCATDLAPTLIDMLGLPVPEHMSGISIREFLAGEADSTGRNYNFGVYHQPLPDYTTEYPTRSISDGRWKYIRNFAPEREYRAAADSNTSGTPWYNFTYGEILRIAAENPEFMAQIDKQSTVELLREGRGDLLSLVVRDRMFNRPAEEFYDLQNDPWELNNLLSDSHRMSREERRAMEHMRTTLAEWMSERNDTGLMMPANP